MTLSIAVELLTGRFTASAFNDRSEPEWPPHPARLFSAMVATWADSDEPDTEERAALEWLEGLGPPQLTCSHEHAVTVRQGFTAFVPVNDPTALARDVSPHYEAVTEAMNELKAAQATADANLVANATTAVERARTKSAGAAARAGAPTGSESPAVVAKVLKTLPENRVKQPRTNPAVVPESMTVWFTWPDAEPLDAHLRALDALLARLGRLGHSSTLVSCGLDDGAPAPTLVPDVDYGVVLRVPRQGMLDRLEQAFTVHQGHEQRLLPASTALYGAPPAKRRMAPGPVLGGDWLVLAMPRRRSGATPAPRTLGVTRSLDLARAVRGALLDHAEQLPPEALTGHRPRANPDEPDQRTEPSDGPHLAVVPLPNVSHRHSDGAIHGVALILPTAIGDRDRAAVLEAVQRWRAANGLAIRMATAGTGSLNFHLDPPRIDPADPSDRHGSWLEDESRTIDPWATLRRGHWCRPSSRWTTVTPIALDRFPGPLRRGTAAQRGKAEAIATTTIARACTFVGLPEPDDVTISFEGPLTAVPAVGGKGGHGRFFPPYRAGSSGQARLCVHARLAFAEPVAGPMLLGAGRYLGYGLCLPIR
ncbi:MAG: type I-G CRISPR-associated protein Csb2 [Acidimicrobiia bacterium]